MDSRFKDSRSNRKARKEKKKIIIWGAIIKEKEIINKRDIILFWGRMFKFGLIKREDKRVIREGERLLAEIIWGLIESDEVLRRKDKRQRGQFFMIKREGRNFLI